LKLIAGYTIVNYYVISKFIFFGPPPTTMEAVLATIVAGGQAGI
jgi:hypothetical protein